MKKSLKKKLGFWNTRSLKKKDSSLHYKPVSQQLNATKKHSYMIVVYNISLSNSMEYNMLDQTCAISPLETLQIGY